MNRPALTLAQPSVNGSPMYAADELDGVLRRLASAAGRDADSIAEARARAASALRAADGKPSARAIALVDFASEVIAARLLEGETSRAVLRTAIDDLARALGLPAEFLGAEICRRALANPRVHKLPVHAAVDARLRPLYLLLPVTDVSLWTGGGAEPVECVAWLGDTATVDGRRQHAISVLRGAAAKDPPASGPSIETVAVGYGRTPLGALVVAAASPDVAGLVESAAASLAPILEKDALLGRSAERQKALVESSERRLTRIGFDLHDGAVQDVSLLAGDIQFFRQQLEEALDGDERKRLLVGRVDDLSARLLAIDGELRGLARSYESPTLLARPFDQVLANEVALFRERTEVRTRLETDGDFSSLSASQRIALLRIVQEALANVREHSGATEVDVSVACPGPYVHAEVRDNGGGFQVDRTLVGAVRSGRLGLVGMSERVRLLGGMFGIESRPGGPTTVRVTLPEWRPLASEALESELEALKEQAQQS